MNTDICEALDKQAKAHREEAYRLREAARELNNIIVSIKAGDIPEEHYAAVRVELGLPPVEDQTQEDGATVDGQVEEAWQEE